MSTDTETYQLTEEEQRNADEITQRRRRLVKALLTATTAFDEAAEEIRELGRGRVYDNELAENWSLDQLVTGARTYLDALTTSVDRAIGESGGRSRAESKALSSYLDALANAVPLLSPSALAARPIGATS